MKGGAHDGIPVNLELLSNDNRVGVVLVGGCLLAGGAVADLMGWYLLFAPEGVAVSLLRPVMLVLGPLLILLAARRLLIPGCRPLLKINFGGVHDLRLLTGPLRWSAIVAAHRPRGLLGRLLPGVVLELQADYDPAGVETFWSRLLHLPLRLRGSSLLFLECATLDHGPEAILGSIQSHLRARSRVPGGCRR
ncbi:MAG: hypothetical protein HQL95_07260 [Magnetococcales bacterium]|nr:hypothetical protein [Magnetococcales bacterium]